MLRRVRRLPTTVVSFGMQKERLLRLHRFGPSSSRSKDYDDDDYDDDDDDNDDDSLFRRRRRRHRASTPQLSRGVAKADEKNDDDDDDDSWCIVAGHNASSSSKSSKSSSSSSQPSLLKSSFKKMYTTLCDDVRSLFFLPRDNVKDTTLITNTYSHYDKVKPLLFTPYNSRMDLKRQKAKSIQLGFHPTF